MPFDCCLQGLPFCIAGAGDLLALFRCVSCRYKFSTDKLKPGLMVRQDIYFTFPAIAQHKVMHRRSQQESDMSYDMA